jgi:hypothetical protein|tara:strand:+ start:5994 stop:8075 length:2082 start_codon:yes stop_codon:yes gene_type:complete
MAVIKEYEMKISVKDAQFNVQELNKSLAAQDDLVQELTDNISDFERELDKMNTKDTNRIKNTKELIKVTKKQLAEEKSGIKQIKTERIEANKVLKDATKNEADFGGVLGFIDGKLGGAISGMKAFTKTITGATKGFKLMKIAWMATGLGALVLLITSITGAFTRSEEGQESFARGMKMIGAVVNQVMDLFANFGTAIIDAVTNPVESLKSFGNSIQEFVMDKVQLVIDGMGLMGSALTKLFAGDFKGAIADAGEGFVNINRGLNPAVIATETLVKGTIALGKATADLIKETAKEVDVMQKVTKMRQKAHHIERDLQVERAKADREINEIRLQAEDRVNNSAADRIALLRKAQGIEENITKKEIAAKQLMLDAMVKEQSLGLSTMEDKDALAALQAELINLDTKKLRSQRLLQTQVTTALNEEKAAKAAAQKIIDDEIAAEEKKVADALLKEQQVETKRLEDLKKIKDDFDRKIIEEEAITFEAKAQLEKAREIAKLDALGASEAEKAKIVAFYNNKIQIARDKDDAAKVQQDKAVMNAKMDIAKQGFALVGELAGKDSKIGKAMAIGQATISGYQAVQNAFTTASASPITAGFPAYPFIQAGLAGAFAAVNIRKIASAKPVGSSPPPSAGRPPAPTIPSEPPAFNTVGASDTNQLADAIGSQSKQPIKTFVVAGDVTTAQGLERNTISAATIG